MAHSQEPVNTPSTASTAPAPTAAPYAPPRRPNMFRLVLDACKADSASLISHALSFVSSPDSRDSEQETLNTAVRMSIRRNACKVLTLVLEHGAKVPDYSNLGLEEGPSTELLDILLAHGWDINARSASQQPFLWGVVHDGDLVAYGLKNGATTIPKDLHLATEDERLTDQCNCPPILDLAASQSTVATFELLRSHGAPLGPLMLHMAAKASFKSGSDSVEVGAESSLLDKDLAKTHSERLAMVVHIVDTLGVDPNAQDQPAGYSLGNHWGTPLCYVAHSTPSAEVVQFLLQRGADPDLVIEPAGWSALELAWRFKNQRFLDLVENWKRQQKEALQPSQ
ncbi:MAG: hypothetical protein M1829_005223 [Trizodia sp. TS-e1964]|nr:MAG: hypothetical protein M1829_005223 [Trizodia sp. TS-e1964]